MFDLLKGLLGDLKALTSRQDVPNEERVATAGLLIHMVAIDGRASPAEQASLRQALARNFEMTPAQAESLMETARQRAAEEADFFAMTSVLKRSLDGAGRLRIIEMMWEIAFADGVIHEFEDNVVWRVAELLEVPHKDRVALRAKIAARTGQ